MVHVGHALDLRIALLHHRIEGHLAGHGEGRGEGAQGLHGRVGTHMLVVVQDHGAHLVLHAEHGLGKAAFAPGLGGALLALHRIGVHVVAGEAVEGRDQVGADALRSEIGLEGRGRVGRPGAAVRAHGHAAHALHPAADGHAGFPGHHLGGGHVAGLEARRAEAVHLHPRCRFGVVGGEHGGAGDVRALLAHGGDAAQHHVVDELGVQPVAVAEVLQNLRRQREGGDFVQGAVLLALAARGAHRVEDVGVSHGRDPSVRR